MTMRWNDELKAIVQHVLGEKTWLVRWLNEVEFHSEGGVRVTGEAEHRTLHCRYPFTLELSRTMLQTVEREINETTRS